MKTQGYQKLSREKKEKKALKRMLKSPRRKCFLRKLLVALAGLVSYSTDFIT
jgi:hypothetical protein